MTGAGELAQTAQTQASDEEASGENEKRVSVGARPALETRPQAEHFLGPSVKDCGMLRHLPSGMGRIAWQPAMILKLGAGQVGSRTPQMANPAIAADEIPRKCQTSNPAGAQVAACTALAARRTWKGPPRHGPVDPGHRSYKDGAPASKGTEGSLGERKQAK